MKILWPNVFAFALLIFAFWLAVSNHEEIKMSLATIGDVGSGDSSKQMRGLIVLTVCFAILIAILRVIISQSNQKKD
ncbi:MAG: hypothetical protein MI923_03195 [Phycisphaerales bacterium]|nr:hypothetical protein [Phycisphaerales bacterium]